MRKIYVKLFTAILFLLVFTQTKAQLTGNKSIPGDYATIAAAVADLNAQGVGASGVIFNVAAGHTETTDIPVITASGTAANTILFQKFGAGANPKITPLTAGTIASSTTLGANGDGIVVINGGDYITFDGIDLSTNPAFTTTGMYEYGYLLKKASATDACKNVTIRNCVITLNKAAVYSFGIYVSNISGTTNVTVTAEGGRSEDIKIYNNTITNAYGGIQLRGFSASTPWNLYDQNISVGVDGPNTISNYGGGASTTYGIYGIYQNNLKINNNVISGGDNTTTTHYGIFMSTSNNSNIDVDNNTISITNHATTSQVAGISLQTGTTTGTTNTQNIRNNTITNITRPAVTSGVTYFIYTTSNYPQNLNITGNTIGSSSFGSTGALYGIYQLSNPVNVNISNNNINNITRTSTTSTGAFYGINSDNSTATTQTTISGNVIHTLTGNGSTGAVGGINCATQTTHNVFNNKIYNITSNHASGVVYGLTLASGTDEYNVYNNLIGDLKAPITSSTSDAIRGINITTTSTTSNVNLYFNTIYLSATSTGTDFSTSGVYATTSTTATTATLNMNNNIIVNKSIPNGTGLTSAFRRSSTSLTNYGSGSNNNLFYAGSPSASRLIFYDGTNADQTLADFKTRVAPREVNSVTEDPNFVSTNGTDVTFLHINTTISTQIESGGVAIGGITTDYDGDTRNATTPDIGADEFNGVSADLSAPLIVYTPLPASCNTTNRTLTGVTISDASGVPTAGAFMPRIYYRKNAGAWFSQPGTLASGTGTNGTWDFTIQVSDMGGVAFSDIVYYYVIAQDIAGTTNIASLPAGVVATNVNSITTHPVAPNYYVVGGSLNGTYTIGASGDLKTLSNAVAVYNACPVGGPVVFSLIDATYSSSETFPIAINENANTSSTNTLTIQPAAGNAAIITGAGSPLIDLNGADNIIINGVNAGGSSFTIRNTATNGAAIRFINDASNNTIQNLTAEGAVTTTTQGVIFLSTGTTTGNDNNTISNNTIRDRSDAAGVPAVLVYSSTGSGTILNSNITVTGNTLKNFTSSGINVSGTGTTNGNENWTITNNEIFQENARTSANTGIIFSTQGTGLISQNYIHDLNTTSTVTGITLNDPRNTTVSRNRIIQSTVAASTGTWTGISFIGNSTGDPTVTIVNNQVSLIPTGTNDQVIYGIRDNSVADNTMNVYYNSVVVGGTSNGTDNSWAFQRATSTPSNLNLQNNIFFNVRTGGTGSHFAGGDQSMGTGSFSSNYNIWTGTGATAANFMDRGTASAGTPLSFAGWQATAGTPDLNSSAGVAGSGDYTVASMFVSATDLHIAAGAVLPSNAGNPIAGITIDIDNELRSVTTPDIGSDEFTPPAGVDVGVFGLADPIVKSCYSNAETVRVTIRNFSGVAHDFALFPVTVNVSVTGTNPTVFTPVIINTGTLASGGNLDVLITNSFDMSALGTYTFNATTVLAGDITPGNNAMTPVDRTAAITAGTISTPFLSYCSSASPTLTLTGSTGGDIQWQTSNTSVSGPWTNVGSNSNTYTVSPAITTTTYYQAVTSCGTNSLTSNVITITVLNPPVLTTTPGNNCGSGSVTLEATTAAGMELKWYDVSTGGTPLATGPTFVTPVLVSTTTYYVEASTVGASSATAGRVAPQSASTGFNGNNYGIAFTATQEFTINSIDVYPTTATGSIIIRLVNSSGTVIQETGPLVMPAATGTTVGGGATPHTITLNFTVPGSGDYRLVSNSHAGSLIRDNPISGFSYPLPIGSFGSITSGWLSGSANTSTYYYFYNWKVSTGCTNTTRIPVVATILPESVGGTVSANQSICTGNAPADITLTGQTGTVVKWQSSSDAAFTSPTDIAVTSTTLTSAQMGPLTTTTYYRAVVQSATCAPANSSAVTISVASSPSATISYASGPYCISGGTAPVTLTGSVGGTFSASPAGLTIDPSTGLVTPSTSTPNTYTVTYSIPASGGCPAFSTTTTITINAAPTASIAYTGSPYCSNAGSISVTQTGVTGGTYSATPAGLSINTATGEVTPATSTPGVYTVTYTIGASGGCAVFTTTASLTITAAPSATISYAGTPYCTNAGIASVTRTGTAGGTYSAAPAGLIINATTGDITLASSTPGTYTVTYSIPASGGCAVFTINTNVTITAAPTASISYGTNPYCSNGGTAAVTQTGATGGLYSAVPAGLTLDPSTGAITLATSTIGIYTVSYTVPASGGCASFTATAAIEIVSAPSASITYAGSPYCSATGTASVTRTGTAGGTYSASPAGLTINSTTGAINLAASTGGTYTVTYSIAATSGCAAFSTNTTVIISAAGTWVGITSSDWNTATNWCGGIPTSTTDVVIPSAAPNMPVISNGVGSARNLTINAGGSLVVNATGRLDLYGNLGGPGVFNASAGHLAFMGTTNQLTPSLTARNVTMNGESWTPGGNITITGNLVLTDGHVILGNNNLELHNSSTGSTGSHIIINGSGRVTVPDFAASSSVVIPIGADVSSYNPVWLVSNAGHVTDDFTIGIQPGVFINGVSGAYFTSHVVGRTWLIQEGTAGGSNVNVTLQWNADQETPGFDRDKSYVTIHNGTAWPQGLVLPVNGTNPYTHTRLNVSTFGSFSIQTQPIPRPTTGIYPNPTSSQLNVVIDLVAAQKVEITVFDATGKRLMEREANLATGLNLYTMNVSNLPAGLYFIKVSIMSNPEYILTKFVKQ